MPRSLVSKNQSPFTVNNITVIGKLYPVNLIILTLINKVYNFDTLQTVCRKVKYQITSTQNNFTQNLL